MSRAVAILIAGLAIAACAKSPEDDFIGVWYEPDGNVFVQFFEDGTLVIQANESVSGDYRILDDSHMRWDLAGRGRQETMVLTYEFAGDALALVTPDGDEATFIRADSDALPDMQARAAVRDQVSEGLSLSAGAKAAVAEFYIDQGEWPATNGDAGLADANEISGRFTSSVSIDNGVITVTYGNGADDSIQGRTLILTPEGDSNSVAWICGSNSIQSQYLPAACQ